MEIKAIKDIPRHLIDGIERDYDKPVKEGTAFIVTNDKAKELIDLGYASEVNSPNVLMELVEKINQNKEDQVSEEEE